MYNTFQAPFTSFNNQAALSWSWSTVGECGRVWVWEVSGGDGRRAGGEQGGWAGRGCEKVDGGGMSGEGGGVRGVTAGC